MERKHRTGTSKKSSAEPKQLRSSPQVEESSDLESAIYDLDSLFAYENELEDVGVDEEWSWLNDLDLSPEQEVRLATVLAASSQPFAVAYTAQRAAALKRQKQGKSTSQQFKKRVRPGTQDSTTSSAASSDSCASSASSSSSRFAASNSAISHAADATPSAVTLAVDAAARKNAARRAEYQASLQASLARDSSSSSSYSASPSASSAASASVARRNTTPRASANPQLNAVRNPAMAEQAPFNPAFDPSLREPRGQAQNFSSDIRSGGFLGVSPFLRQNPNQFSGSSPAPFAEQVQAPITGQTAASIQPIQPISGQNLDQNQAQTGFPQTNFMSADMMQQGQAMSADMARQMRMPLQQGRPNRAAPAQPGFYVRANNAVNPAVYAQPQLQSQTHVQSQPLPAAANQPVPEAAAPNAPYARYQPVLNAQALQNVQSFKGLQNAQNVPNTQQVQSGQSGFSAQNRAASKFMQLAQGQPSAPAAYAQLDSLASPAQTSGAVSGAFASASAAAVAPNSTPSADPTQKLAQIKCSAPIQAPDANVATQSLSSQPFQFNSSSGARPFFVVSEQCLAPLAAAVAAYCAGQSNLQTPLSKRKVKSEIAHPVAVLSTLATNAWSTSVLVRPGYIIQGADGSEHSFVDSLLQDEFAYTTQIAKNTSTAPKDSTIKNAANNTAPFSGLTVVGGASTVSQSVAAAQNSALAVTFGSSPNSSSGETLTQSQVTSSSANQMSPTASAQTLAQAAALGLEPLFASNVIRAPHAERASERRGDLAQLNASTESGLRASTRKKVEQVPSDLKVQVHANAQVSSQEKSKVQDQATEGNAAKNAENPEYPENSEQFELMQSLEGSYASNLIHSGKLELADSADQPQIFSPETVDPQIYNKDEHFDGEEQDEEIDSGSASVQMSVLKESDNAVSRPQAPAKDLAAAASSQYAEPVRDEDQTGSDIVISDNGELSSLINATDPQITTAEQFKQVIFSCVKEQPCAFEKVTERPFQKYCLFIDKESQHFSVSICFNGKGTISKIYSSGKSYAAQCCVKALKLLMGLSIAKFFEQTPAPQSQSVDAVSTPSQNPTLTPQAQAVDPISLVATTSTVDTLSPDVVSGATQTPGVSPLGAAANPNYNALAQSSHAMSTASANAAAAQFASGRGGSASNQDEIWQSGAVSAQKMPILEPEGGDLEDLPLLAPQRQAVSQQGAAPSVKTAPEHSAVVAEQATQPVINAHMLAQTQEQVEQIVSNFLASQAQKAKSSSVPSRGGNAANIMSQKGIQVQRPCSEASGTNLNEADKLQANVRGSSNPQAYPGNAADHLVQSKVRFASSGTQSLGAETSQIAYAVEQDYLKQQADQLQAQAQAQLPVQVSASLSRQIPFPMPSQGQMQTQQMMQGQSQEQMLSQAQLQQSAQMSSLPQAQFQIPDSMQDQASLQSQSAFNEGLNTNQSALLNSSTQLGQLAQFSQGTLVNPVAQTQSQVSAQTAFTSANSLLNPGYDTERYDEEGELPKCEISDEDEEVRNYKPQAIAFADVIRNLTEQMEITLLQISDKRFQKQCLIRNQFGDILKVLVFYKASGVISKVRCAGDSHLSEIFGDALIAKRFITGENGSCMVI